MRRSGHGSGGGHGMNKVAHTRAPKAEPRPHAINPKAVSQIGTSPFLGRDELRDGKGYASPQGPTSNMGQGPGANRTVYPSGGQHGLRPAREMPEGRDTLAGFGPESVTSKQR